MPAKERRRSGKGEDTRRHILEASVDLFLKNGYEKTTISLICLKAGVLPGSMYNLFRSKGDILAEVVSEGLWETLTDSRKYSEGQSLASALSFPILIQIYMSCRSSRVAELLNAMYSEWEIKDKALSPLIKWIEESEEGRNLMEKPDFDLKAYASIGALSSIIERFHREPEKTDMKQSMMVVGRVFLDLFGLEENLENLVDRAISTFERNKIRICGYLI